MPVCTAINKTQKNAFAFGGKRKYVSSQTQGRFDQNASAFYLKRKYVFVETHLRFFHALKRSLIWSKIPLQDFTPNSDIDWSKSIHEIDLQLYRKYGLDEKEIEFIESHVKEMA